MKVIETKGVPIKMWCENPEEGALLQAKILAELPFAYKWIAVLPDTHTGYGMPIGGVLATKNQMLIPYAVGSDIGCFSGDTEIPLLDGKDYTIKELAEKGHSFLIYSSTQDRRVTVAEATALLTKKNAELFEITLDNGKKIKCTPDQEFRLLDGTYKRTNELKIGSRLLPLYLEEDKDGYLIVVQNFLRSKLKKEVWPRVSWLVAKEGFLGEIPIFKDEITCIHHKDENKRNNLPLNLKFIGNCKHSKLHNTKRIKKGLMEYWNKDSVFLDNRKKAVRKYQESEEGRIKMSVVGTNNIINYMKNNPDDFLEKIKDNGLRGKKYLKNSDSVFIEKQKLGRIKKIALKCIQNYGEINSETYEKTRITLYNYPLYENALIVLKNNGTTFEKLTKINHKIISIKKLDYKEDVYCLKVPKYLNFGLSAGVFVHNCGMGAVKTTYKDETTEEMLKKVIGILRNVIPYGLGGKNKEPCEDSQMPCFLPMSDFLHKELYNDAKYQLGSLGSGNHFLELQKDSEGFLWIMIHSGSRSLGKNICDKYNKIAQEMCAKWQAFPPKDLAWLPYDSEEGSNYWKDMEYATEFALLNRKKMIYKAMEVLSNVFEKYYSKSVGFEEIINIHHNYARFEHHFGENVIVHRKGATSAKYGEIGIIPGSQGTNSYIVKGLGNRDSFTSCSHGAGRKLSRKKAQQVLDLKNEIKMMEDKGIIHSIRSGSDLDEAPGAYKDIECVMKEQEDLVEILHKLTPLAVLKG